MVQRDCDITELITTYANDLPSPGLIDDEYMRWKASWKFQPEIPETTATAIKSCDPSIYPNIYVLLKLACTLNVTSADCERSASVLRRLHTYTRTCMDIERLSSCALIHTHYTFAHNIESIVDRFHDLHPRRMIALNMVYNVQ